MAQLYKKWNWKHDLWPHFTYDDEALRGLELQFSQNTGTVLGILKHVKESEKEDFLVDILSNEALKTSEIEGEYLDRDSVQSSIKQNLGLITDKRKIPPAEYGISEMMVDFTFTLINHLRIRNFLNGIECLLMADVI
ncbi:DUF4172 domain-containing protein [Aquimarina aggregata]|uniref:DUF4172 domain-containing protein n=1 Tax=Aquimarina aggregata TaxID=1642818 RepID=UPI002492E1A6|nr:DUF4172 domain-containing protein [Aquimarina aggregata]